jgi:hypothetical protein
MAHSPSPQYPSTSSGSNVLPSFRLKTQPPARSTELDAAAQLRPLCSLPVLQPKGPVVAHTHIYTYTQTHIHTDTHTHTHTHRYIYTYTQTHIHTDTHTHTHTHRYIYTDTHRYTHTHTHRHTHTHTHTDTYTQTHTHTLCFLKEREDAEILSCLTTTAPSGPKPLSAQLRVLRSQGRLCGQTGSTPPSLVLPQATHLPETPFLPEQAGVLTITACHPGCCCKDSSACAQALQD